MIVFVAGGGSWQKSNLERGYSDSHESPKRRLNKTILIPLCHESTNMATSTLHLWYKNKTNVLTMTPQKVHAQMNSALER